MTRGDNRDNLVKMLLIIFLTAVISIILYSLFLRQRLFFGLGIYYGQSLDINSLVTGSLVFVVKLLWLTFIISLVVGIVMVTKKYLVDGKKIGLVFTGPSDEQGYTCPCCGTRLTAEFKFCPNCKASLKDVCARCGKDLQVGWKSCPWCGTGRSNN